MVAWSSATTGVNCKNAGRIRFARCVRFVRPREQGRARVDRVELLARMPGARCARIRAGRVIGGRTGRTVSAAAAMLGLGVLVCGCSRHRESIQFPAGVLHVPYVPAADLTDCLVASTVMCANYIRGHNQFSSKQARQELAAADLDHTRVGSIRRWLAGHDMRMVPIQGELSNVPPRGLAWWILSRGHPVICVVNKHGGDADYNHAVVVIGVTLDADDHITGLHVLDPASAKQLEYWSRDEFKSAWAPTGHAMLPMFDAPAQSARLTTNRTGSVS